MHFPLKQGTLAWKTRKQAVAEATGPCTSGGGILTHFFPTASALCLCVPHWLDFKRILGSSPRRLPSSQPVRDGRGCPVRGGFFGAGFLVACFYRLFLLARLLLFSGQLRGSVPRLGARGGRSGHRKDAPLDCENNHNLRQQDCHGDAGRKAAAARAAAQVLLPVFQER